MVFSISNAQHMFYHMLPGFVPAYTWVGLGNDANWNTAANWSTGVVPGASHTAIFNNLCVSNCDPTINIPVSILGLEMKSTYAGTITQASGQTITIGSGGWSQDGGAFIGNDANIQINGVTSITNSSSFKATSATLEFKNAVTMPTADFAPNGGTIDLNLNCQAINFNIGTQNFQNFRIVGQCGTIDLQSSVITVTGNLTLFDTNGGLLNNGTVNVAGNITMGSYGSAGTAWVRLVGGNPQALTNADVNQDRPLLPNFEIAKSVGTVATFNGRINLTKDYLYTSGTINMGTSTWAFLQDCSTRNIHPGSWNYPDVIIGHSCGTLDLGTQTLKVTGTLTLNSSFVGKFANGTIEAYGHVTQTGLHGLHDASPATGLLKIIGSSSQTITGNATGRFPKMEIASTGGTVTFVGTLNMMSDFTYTSGTVDAGTSTMTFGIGSDSTITAGAVNYYNVTFGGDNRTQNLNAGAMNVTNTLLFSDVHVSSGNVNNGTINASGAVQFSNYGKLGSAILNYTGTASTTLTIGATAQTLSSTHNVAKTGAGTVTLVANTSFTGAGRNFSITSGTLNVAGFTFAVNSLITIGASGRLLCNGGTATAGSWAISGQISCGTGQGITWTGAGGDNLWSTAANWTNNTIPGATDIALFNGSVCVGALCDAQINSNLSLRGLQLQSTYPGILTQNATRTLTVGTAGYTQAGGTFSGGDSAVTMNGSFLLSGGTYTATSSTWTQSANLTITGSPTFNHNAGTWTTSSSITIAANGSIFNNVTFGGNATNQNLGSQTMTVNGTLTLSDSNFGSLNSGTIESRGNIVGSSTGKSGTVVVVINGTGAQQITSVNSATIPEIRINKSTDTLTLSGTIKTYYNWTWIAGAVDAGTSTLIFAGYSTTQMITPGTINYYNVTFAGDSVSHNLNAGVITVTNLATFSDVNGGPGTISNGTVEVKGNLTIAGQGKRVSGTILVNGTGAQTYTGSAGSIGNVVINKPSDTLTLAGTISNIGNWTWLAGTVDAGTSSINFTASVGGQSYSITPGPVSYNNVTFSGNSTSFNLNGASLFVNGILVFSDINGTPGTISNGTIEARGDISVSGQGKAITGLLLVNGTGAQNWTGISSARVGHTQINKASGTLTLSNFIRISGNFTSVAGTVNAGTSTVQFDTTNTISVGSVQFNNVIFAGNTVTNNLNAETMIVLGDLTLQDTSGSPGSINNGNIDVRGNISITGQGRIGTALLSVNGTTNSTITWTAGNFMSTTNVFSKTGGASVVLATNAAFTAAGRDLTITSGIFDLAGFDLTVNDVLTVGAGAILKCNGGEFTSGTLTNSGTVNCPGYSNYEFNWTGAGGNTNWNTPGNWQGGVVPGINDIAAFQDSTCGGTCNVNINFALNVRGVRIYSPYSGTIAQDPGQTMNVGVRGWRQPSGIFFGSNAPITYNGTFNLTGGTYTATSATTFARSISLSGSPTFVHNNGTWQWSSINSVVTTTNTFAFNHVNFSGNQLAHTISGTMRVNGNLGLHDTGGYWIYAKLNGGIIELYGNIENSGYGKNGTTEIRMMGNPMGQTITGAGGNASIPALRIQAGANTVQLAGTIITSNAFSFISGALNAGTSTLVFNEFSGGGSQSIIPGTATYNHVNFLGHDTAWNLNGGSLNVSGDLTVSDTGAWPGLRLINNGTINASGNVSILNNGSNGSANFNFVGTTNTSLSMSTTGNFPQGTITMNKSVPAKITLLTNARFNGVGTQNLAIGANSTLDMAGNNLTVGNNISNSGVLQRGTSPTCGTISQGGSFSGNAAICP